MPDSKLDLLQGTLDLMVLQKLDVMGPLHGYRIARRIEQLSENEILAPVAAGLLVGLAASLGVNRILQAQLSAFHRTTRPHSSLRP